MFKYSEESPTFIEVLKPCRGRSRGNKYPGSMYKDRDGSVRYYVYHNGKNVAISRLVWALHHGTCPASHVVDHIDGNTENNNITNLRLVSQQENCRNKHWSAPTDLPTTVVKSTKNGNTVWSVKDELGKVWRVNCKNLDGEYIKLVCCEFRRRLKDSGKLKSFTDDHLNIAEDPYLPGILDSEISSVLGIDKVRVPNVYRNKRLSRYEYRENGTIVCFSIRDLGDEKARGYCEEYSKIRNGLMVLPGIPRHLSASILQSSSVFDNITLTHYRKPGQVFLAVRKVRNSSVLFKDGKLARNYQELIIALRDYRKILDSNYCA